jgi:hypothetical protein
MTAGEAAAIGQEALIWLAGQPEALERFLNLSGLEPALIRSRASDPEFLGFILEFLLGSDETLLAFAADTGLRPEDPARARLHLAGGEPPNWT